MPESPFTRETLRITGGLLVWGGHLGAVYALAGVVCARGWADRRLLGLPVVPLGVAAATLIALAAAAVLLLHALLDRRRGAAGSRGFASLLTAWVAGFALVAVAWTGVVALVVRPPCPAEPRLGREDSGVASPAPAITPADPAAGRAAARPPAPRGA